MISYQPLTSVPLVLIHRCFIDAFSDYQVKIEMPLERLCLMFKRRGFDPNLSVGAFAQNSLVGLILNGRREWCGRDTMYDTGTGVVPEYRRQGITSAMFQEVLKLAGGFGVQQYLLEVIRTNIPAVELYQKQGFQITRTFECYRAAKEDILRQTRDASHTLDFASVEEFDWELLSSFWDFQPSWQNSIASVQAVPEELAAVVARDWGQVVGYGIVERRSGDIPQMAVAKRFRGRGIGRSILNRLALNCEANSLAFVNVENGHPSVEASLQKNGISSFGGQYEMVLDLSGARSLH